LSWQSLRLSVTVTIVVGIGEAVLAVVLVRRIAWACFVSSTASSGSLVIVVSVLARQIVLVAITLGKVGGGAVQIENVGMQVLEAVEGLGLAFGVFFFELLNFDIVFGEVL
jgi:hypothetical protein